MASSGKLPWFQFYPGDWLQDTRMLDLQSKGAWFEIINAMWTAPERGVISGTLEEFSLLLGCYIDVTSTILERFERLKICDFSRDGNGIVTLKCRRIVREEAERENNRERVAKFRKKQSGNGHVTPDVTDKKSEVRSQKSEEEPPQSPKVEEVAFSLVTPEESRQAETPRPVSSRGKKRINDEARSIDVPLFLRTPEFMNSWEDWLSDMEDRKERITGRAAKGQLKELDAIGEPRAIAAIEISIARRWKHIHELDGQNSSQNGNNGHSQVDGPMPLSAPLPEEHVGPRDPKLAAEFEALKEKMIAGARK
jgi:uncharacterized protein YdaU (DUF1376 family)